MVDGSSRLQVIWNIVLPMAAPGLLTAGIFCFILAWNEFLFALILTNRDAVTLPIGLALFRGEEGDLVEPACRRPASSSWRRCSCWRWRSGNTLSRA